MRTVNSPEIAEDVPGKENGEGKFFQEKRVAELNDQIRVVRLMLSFYLDRETNASLGYTHESLSFLNKYDSNDLDDLWGMLNQLSSPESMVQEAHDSSIYTLTSVSENYPDRYHLFKEILPHALRIDHEVVTRTFEDHLKGKEVDQKLYEALEERVVRLGGDLSEEEKNKLRMDFPSGNFVLHSANLERSLEIIESGKIKSSCEIALERNLPEWGSGGSVGVSFNFNDIRVLTGTRKHLMGFVADPLNLVDKETKYSLAPSAAVFEVQLVPKSFDQNISYYNRSPKEMFRMVGGKLPEVRVENTFVYCRELDLDAVKKVLAASKVLPKGIFVYPNSALRTESWIEPRGDARSAGSLMNETLDAAGIKPSISWADDLFPERPRIKDNTFVVPQDISGSYSLIKKGNELVVDKGGVQGYRLERVA